MSLLEVSGLTKMFDGVPAVDGVSFTLEKGEMLALIGPNGAGKSTCFNMLNGQLKATSGTATLAGRPLLGRRPRAIWRLGVGRTFQITATFASMTVRENVQMALMARAKASFGLFARATRVARDEADRLLGLVSMAGDGERPAGELAYGDLKRLELAVALANRPSLLLMDEPTAGMAPAERVALMELTAGIVAGDGVGVLFTEHDMDVVFAHAHRILVLNRGRLIAEGSGPEIRGNALVREVYLGGGSTYGAGPKEDLRG